MFLLSNRLTRKLRRATCPSSLSHSRGDTTSSYQRRLESQRGDNHNAGTLAPLTKSFTPPKKLPIGADNIAEPISVDITAMATATRFMAILPSLPVLRLRLPAIRLLRLRLEAGISIGIGRGWGWRY